MIVNIKTECSSLKQTSVIKLLVAEKCKQCEIYTKMCVVYGEACFSRLSGWYFYGILLS